MRTARIILTLLLLEEGISSLEFPQLGFTMFQIPMHGLQQFQQQPLSFVDSASLPSKFTSPRGNNPNLHKETLQSWKTKVRKTMDIEIQ